jgi:outer membrane protein assembly factor BamB
MSDAIQPRLPVGYTGGAIQEAKPVVAATVKPRMWPALVIVAIQWIALIVPARLAPGDMAAFFGFMIAIYGGLGGFLLWWLFFSRVSWADVGLGLLAIALGLIGLGFLGHDSVRAMGGMPIIMYVAPMVTTAIIVWLGVTPFLSWRWRRAGIFVVALAVCAYFGSLRLEGMNGVFAAAWQPRWRTTDEDRFLAERTSLQKVESKGNDIGEPLKVREGDWPAFRGGPARDGVNRAAAMETDWAGYPPKLLWKKRVGPGWSSFAVVGDRAFTQEQRGPAEVVVCYDAATGNEIWEHKDAVRFAEVIGGPGPRATPTFHEGKLYTQGATGVLNCLDARTGASLWTRDIAADSKSPVPEWGFSASPLVFDGVVTVYGGAPGKAVLAYDAATGKVLWQRGDGDKSYCSTQLSRIDGVDQILIATNLGAFGLEPKTGTMLWNHEWDLKKGMARVTQPNVVGSEVLVGTGFGVGMRRIHVDRKGDAWESKEVWTSVAIKPYFNDFVVHQGHIYGFDGPMFTCVSLDDGKRKWRERGYGSGQVLLLEKQSLLLVLSESAENETGEITLVSATPGYKEVAKIPGITGKTWNHPVVAHGRLFIRNGAEMACFELLPPRNFAAK